MPVEMRGQTGPIWMGHPFGPSRLGYHILCHQRVDIDQRRLKKMQGQYRDLLRLHIIAAELSLLKYVISSKIISCDKSNSILAS